MVDERLKSRSQSLGHSEGAEKKVVEAEFSQDEKNMGT